MPQVVYDNLMTLAQPLPAGGQIESATVDVNGARAVNIMLAITGPDPNVHWTVTFGPTQNNGLFRAATGTFAGDEGGFATQFPVFGPNMVVLVENLGKQDTHCDGKVYFIREVP
jgi:hypothetical protein